MEDEVFDMDEFAVNPQRGTGLGKILAFEEGDADGGAGNALVQRVRAMAASKAGRIRSLMLIFVRS
ncbi:hypothetical protein D3C86_2108240 [compost metagenome]